jgi:hypothetical protein
LSWEMTNSFIWNMKAFLSSAQSSPFPIMY